MDNILDNVVFLVKSIKKRKVESGYTYGEIILSDSLIEKITDLNDNNLIDVSISNKTINIEELNSNINLLASIKIKTGDLNNYFDTIEDFVSGNKFECKLVDFYIDDIDYREVKTDNNCIILYKNNLKIIDFLKEIANNIKKSGNNLELFFYRTGVGVDLKIDYDIESLKKIDFVIPDDFKTQILDSFNGKDKKELFINELINFIESNNCSYVNLIENWNTLLSNYTKSYSLFVAGFSFEKIKTSSIEHFQKLVDRIYESIGKVSSYIFGIPIGYILLINNFDFSGEQCFKNTSLLFLGIIFLILIWFVLFKNIDESIKSIEKDIDDFLGKIKNIKELEDIHQKLETLKSSELKKQLFKLNLVKILTFLIFAIILSTFLFIVFDVCIFM